MTELTAAGAEPLSPAQIEALQARQLAFFEARLVSPQAEGEWRANLTAGFAELVRRPLAELVDAESLGQVVDEVLGSKAAQASALPLARKAAEALLAELRAHRGTLGDHVPGGSRRRLDALLERPGLMPERLLRHLAEQPAVEEVAREVLFVTLKEFSDKVNPFFAEWGLPALLKRLLPFGVGGLGKLESVKAEFDRRLEPEIRKFLLTFARTTLRKSVEVTLEKGDEPKFLALRKSLSAWVLDQEVAALASGADGELLALAAELGVEIGAHVATLEAIRARRRQVLREAHARHGHRPLGELLALVGFSALPDPDALAKATWPVVRAALGSDAARGWIGQMLREFWSAVAAGGAPA